MRRLPGILVVVLLVSVVVAADVAPAFAGASRTRSGGSGAKATRGGSPARVSRAPAGYARGAPAGAARYGHRAPTRASGSRHYTAPRIASGRATYGYRHGLGRFPYHGYHRYPYYGYYPYFYGYYGYPGFYGYWGWPYLYGGLYVSVGGAYGGGGAYYGGPVVIKTRVQPKHSSVSLDGVAVGQARDYSGTWDKLRVDPGRHVLEFSAPGYQTLRLELDARPGGRFTIEEQLREGQGLGPRSTPERPREQAKPAAEPEFRYRPETPAAAPQPQGLQRGFLKIAVEPPDAAVYLDGEFLARADELARLHGAIPVAQGPHVLEVVRPGFRNRTIDIEVQGREPVEVRLELEPN